MNLSETDRALLSVIAQAASLIGGGLLLVAASILFAALMMSSDPGPGLAITALINAALFYVGGMRCVSPVFHIWKRAAKQADVERARQP
jgi:TRAP-type C4-dicarboxylate transport system permease small subunit